MKPALEQIRFNSIFEIENRRNSGEILQYYGIIRGNNTVIFNVYLKREMKTFLF